MTQSTRIRCMMHQKRQRQPIKPRQRKPRQKSLRRKSQLLRKPLQKSQLLRKPLQKSQPPRNKQPNWLVNRRKGQAFISSLPLTEIIRAARFGGPFSVCVFWPMSQGPCLVGKVLSEADLIGWAVLYVLARPDFLRLIGVLAGFF